MAQIPDDYIYYLLHLSFHLIFFKKPLISNVNGMYTPLPKKKKDFTKELNTTYRLLQSATGKRLLTPQNDFFFFLVKASISRQE